VLKRRTDLRCYIQAQDPIIVGSRRTCTFFKVQGVAGLTKSRKKEDRPSSRRTVHHQAGHVGIDCHFADERVKGIEFPNLSISRYAKLRFNLSHRIKVESGPLIQVHVGVSGIDCFEMSKIITTGIPMSRYAKSRFNLSHQIKVESRPLIQVHVGVSEIDCSRCQILLTTGIPML
jgi:hypothetical protein